MMGRVLGIDYGAQRIGVAISDELKLIAQGLETIEYMGEAALMEAIKGLVRKHEVELVIVGYPLSLKGRATRRSEAVRAFAGRLKASVGLPVELVDERLSSVQAERIIREAGLSPSRHRPLVDKLSATLLLQGWLEQSR